jgi:hypothetical protein
MPPKSMAQAIDFVNEAKIVFFASRMLTNHGGLVRRFHSYLSDAITPILTE